MSPPSLGAQRDLCKHDGEKEQLEAEPHVNGKTIPNVWGGVPVVLISFSLLQLLYSFSTVSIAAASSFSCEMLLIMVSVSKYSVCSPSVVFPEMC